MDPELRRQVPADLAYLRATWTLQTINDDFLRRDSTVLRRLLVDGLLNRYRRLVGQTDPVVVTAPDLDAFLEGLDPGGIDFALAGGARHNGAYLGPVLSYRARMSPDLIRRRAAAGPQQRTSTLPDFLDSACAFSKGISVSRRHLIQYIANKKGGTHYDPRRGGDDGKADSFRVLDRLTGRGNLLAKDPVYFELLAVGQQVITSPQVLHLISAT